MRLFHFKYRVADFLFHDYMDNVEKKHLKYSERKSIIQGKVYDK